MYYFVLSMTNYRLKIANTDMVIARRPSLTYIFNVTNISCHDDTAQRIRVHRERAIVICIRYAHTNLVGTRAKAPSKLNYNINLSDTTCHTNHNFKLDLHL